MDNTTDYGFDLHVSHSEVMATAKRLAKMFNENDFGLDMSGTVETEHVAKALRSWLPVFLQTKVDDMVVDLDRAIDNAPRRVSRPFFDGVIAEAGLVHAEYRPEPTGKDGDKWVCATMETGGKYVVIEYPEHGFFDDEDDCKAKCHALNVARSREKGGHLMQLTDLVPLRLDIPEGAWRDDTDNHAGHYLTAGVSILGVTHWIEAIEVTKAADGYWLAVSQEYICYSFDAEGDPPCAVEINGRTYCLFMCPAGE